MKEAVYQTIRERILYLEYAPGQILSEQKIAKEFGLSRSPIKDVVNRLEWEQFVRVIPRTGSMVTEIEFSRAMHVYQVRFEIEDFEASLAEAQFNDAHKARLDALSQACDRILDGRDPRALADIDIELRQIIHDAAGNPVLADVSDKMYWQTFRLWYSIMAKGGWAEEVLAVKQEVEKLVHYFSSSETNVLGAIRRSQLADHFERLRKKFLGA